MLVNVEGILVPEALLSLNTPLPKPLRVSSVEVLAGLNVSSVNDVAVPPPVNVKAAVFELSVSNVVAAVPPTT